MVDFLEAPMTPPQKMGLVLAHLKSAVTVMDEILSDYDVAGAQAIIRIAIKEVERADR